MTRDGPVVAAHHPQCRAAAHVARRDDLEVEVGLGHCLVSAKDLQTMHLGLKVCDKGGNDVKANYGIIAGRTNLHSIWDGYLAERAISTPPAGPRALLAATSRDERAANHG